MKTQKTYIATGNRHRLNIEIKVKGKWQRVDFSNGGISINGNARFQTSDSDIQKALESSPMFGDIFKLQSQKQIPEALKNAQKEHEIENEDNNTQGDELGLTGNSGEESMSFPNFNSLRDYLVNEHKCKPAEVRNLNDALATAKKLGLDVIIE